MDGHDVTITLHSGSTSELHPYGTAAKHRRQVQRLSRMRCSAERQMRQARWAVRAILDLFDARVVAAMPRDKRVKLIEILWPEEVEGREG